MEQQYPLTKQQEGLWIEWKLHPDNTSYNTCVKLKLIGKFDKSRFEKALHHVVNFFSSMRVYFVEENGVPYQRIKESGDFIMAYEDISGAEGSKETQEQQEKAREFLENQLRKPVDLKTFPIVRASLIKTSDTTHYFIGLVPHVISDGVSAVLFLEAASIAYNKGYDGLVEAYGDQQKDWGDYFEEAKAKYDETLVNNAEDYWSERMSGAQHLVDFSYGQQNTSNMSVDATKTGKRVYFDLDHKLSKALKDYSRSQRTTLFSTLVATFSLLVHRYYKQDDVLIGYPVNIRPPGYKHLFGFFVNIIPIRIDLSGDPSYQELVGRVSAARKADKKFQTFPAMDLVREIRKTISNFDGRVFNVSMAQTVSRLVNLRLDGVNSEPLEAEYNDVNDDLSLSYEILEDDRIGLWIEYRESLFTSEFIEQMIAHMRKLLAQTVENPEHKLSQYELLDNTEQQIFLNKLALPDASVDNRPAHADTIHGMIEDCAAAKPDHVALVYNDEEITYAQMNARANALAHYLRERGAKTHDKIALCLNRGPEMIISLLAVMKAGCAYVPIPPGYPSDRMAFVVDDAGCDIVITQSALAEKFESIKTGALIQVDTTADELATQETGNVESGISTDDPCYVIYTSGSTGNPKGVLLHHGNLIPRLLWLQDEMQINDSDVVLQNTDYSFDVSVAEIYWPLTIGARLILTDSEKYKDPSYLIDLMNQHKVTTTCFVPSLLNNLLAVLKNDRLDTLKRVLAAGEALPPTLVKTYYQKCSGNLYNVYGPTEGAIYAAFTLCEKDSNALSVPIGRPLGDTMLYILDDQGRPQPTGVAGELHIGGPGVAQGYLNREELTEERFIADPFSDDKNARLYKTGDLTRFLENTDIEYLGRMDSQVKIRGFRVELAEIESVMSSFKGIEDVAVIDYGESTHKRLVAYYVAPDIDTENEDALLELKAFLASKLTDYMVPAFFIKIDSIPRLASGKINRRALPNPENLVKKRAAYVAPSNETETQMVKIWSSILRVPEDKIGIHDSFFELGGDSLMAIQFVCEAEEQGLALPTDSLFNYKTISELAGSALGGNYTKVQIDQGAVEGRYPLLPRQAKFFADGFKQQDHWNRFFFFEVNHNPDPAHLKQAFDTVLMHHDNIRICFTKNENGDWEQNCSAGLPDENYVFTHDLSSLPTEQQETEIIKICNEAHTALDLEKAPLIRVLYFKTGDDQGKMGVVMHHLLVDIVSSRIIFEDFVKSYEGLRRNIEFPLPEKTSSIKDWATYLSTLSQSGDFTDALSYWTPEHMAPAPAITIDHEGKTRGYEKSAGGERLILDEATTSALLHDVPGDLNMNIQDVLLACLNMATHDWTGDPNLIVNICGHGRTGASGFNLSRTAGWVNTVFPVRLSRDSAQDTRSFILNAKSQIDAVPQENGAYNILRYISKHPEITKHRTPDVFFNYVSNIDAVIPEGVSFNPVPEPDGIIGSHEDNHLCYLLYIEAAVVEKCLNIQITYTRDIFKSETVQKFGQLYKSTIETCIHNLFDGADLIRAAE